MIGGGEGDNKRRRDPITHSTHYIYHLSVEEFNLKATMTRFT